MFVSEPHYGWKAFCLARTCLTRFGTALKLGRVQLLHHAVYQFLTFLQGNLSRNMYALRCDVVSGCSVWTGPSSRNRSHKQSHVWENKNKSPPRTPGENNVVCLLSYLSVIFEHKLLISWHCRSHTGVHRYHLLLGNGRRAATISTGGWQKNFIFLFFFSCCCL